MSIIDGIVEYITTLTSIVIKENLHIMCHTYWPLILHFNESFFCSCCMFRNTKCFWLNNYLTLLLFIQESKWFYCFY